MTTYEILLLLDPEHAEARQDEIVARTRELVESSGGSWQSHDVWGRRRLAYPILRKEEGVYHLLVFAAEPATLDEISRVLKIDDAVLRHLATRHIAGSRTSAPRDDAAAIPADDAAAVPADDAAAVPADEAAAAAAGGGAGDAAPKTEEATSEPDVSDGDEPEYAQADTGSDEEGE